MNPKKLRQLHRQDRIASVLIKAGGVSIILSMIAMIVLLVRVAAPLFLQPEIELLQTWKLDEKVLLTGIDDYGETSYTLNSEGVLSFFHVSDHVPFEQSYSLLEPENGDIEGPERQAAESVELSDQALSLNRQERPPLVALVTGSHEIILHSGNRIDVHRIVFTPDFDLKGERHIEHHVEKVASMKSVSQSNSLPFDLTVSDGKVVFLEQIDAHSFSVTIQTRQEDLFGDIEESLEQFEWSEPSAVFSSCSIGEHGDRFWVGDNQGVLRFLEIQNGQIQESDQVIVNPSDPVKHLTSVYGRVSVAATTQSGMSSVFMAMSSKIKKTHELASDLGAVDRVYASRRHKTLFFLTDNHVLAIHMTSEKVLFNIATPGKLVELVSTDRGNLLSGLDADGQLWLWSVHNPHPEISFKTLWKKVWYEGYQEPTYTWQSSSASDDFEPKMSLVPLVFGSLKGTFYGMLFALPLALLGALYTSQIMRPKWKKIVKPAIELMAGVPSVIIGFLGALWLAPIVEKNMVGIFLMPIIFTLAAFLGGKVVSRYRFRNQYEGNEFIWIFPFMVLSVWISLLLGGLVESVFFSGNLQQWLFESFGSQVDQRNCVVISFALGFAVIPVVFTIAEDAMSNVPPAMVAGSLAMGANLWQTVRKIVLPVASPGIFAAIMIGFGRAVGETMIVLMATGNTPIMSASIFNGMRTLAANIAVEIPEAPVGGSLYRLLFLSALLLFLMTFVVNTLAEFVRGRLRRKYGQN